MYVHITLMSSNWMEEGSPYDGYNAHIHKLTGMGDRHVM